MYNDILIYLLISHILGDFYLQNTSFCKKKCESKFKSKYLWIHALIVALTSWIIIFDLSFWWCALIIFMTHAVIDGIKVSFIDRLWIFIADQALHLVVLSILAITWNNGAEWTGLSFLNFYEGKIPLFIAIFLFIFKPSNILIKKILKEYKIEEKEDSNKVGALIGNLERALTVLLIMVGEFQSVGFLIAAKSLLRFKDTDTKQTEYVLAGTLLSFGIAIACGLFLCQLF